MALNNRNTTVVNDGDSFNYADSVNNSLSNSSEILPGSAKVYIPFISIKIGGKNGISLTQNLSDNRPDYFTELSHKRYVSQANTARINLAYCPKPGESPMLLESAISQSNGQCLYQYGVPGYRSKYYRGMITNYTVSFNDGYLSYSLELVSRSVLYNYQLIKTSVYDIPAADAASLRTYWKNIWDHTGYRIVNANQWNESWIKQDEILGRKLYSPEQLNQVSFNQSDVIWTMQRIVKDFIPGYTFSTDVADNAFTYPTAGISIINKNAIEGLKEIANSLIDSKDSNVYHYKIIVDDSSIDGDNGTIKLVRFGGLNSKTEGNTVFRFEWGTKNTNVLSFDPKYQGNVAIFRTPDLNDNQYFKSYNLISSIESGADALTLTKSFVTTTPAFNNKWSDSWNNVEFDKTLLKNINWFTEHANYPYTAKLSVLGLSDTEFELCKTIVNVVPYINGQVHHTGGLYMVTGIEDIIDSSGFKTNLDLVKLAEESEVYRSQDHQIYYREGYDPIPAIDVLTGGNK